MKLIIEVHDEIANKWSDFPIAIERTLRKEFNCDVEDVKVASLEDFKNDIELAQALKFIFELENWTTSIALDRGMAGKRINSIDKLIKFYREQKGGKWWQK